MLIQKLLQLFQDSGTGKTCAGRGDKSVPAKASEQTGGMTWVLTSFSGFCTKNHFRTDGHSKQSSGPTRARLEMPGHEYGR